MCGVQYDTDSVFGDEDDEEGMEEGGEEGLMNEFRACRIPYEERTRWLLV